MLTFGSRDEAESFIRDTFPVAEENNVEAACDDCDTDTTPAIEFIIEDTDEDWIVCENGHTFCP